MYRVSSLQWNFPDRKVLSSIGIQLVPDHQSYLLCKFVGGSVYKTLGTDGWEYGDLDVGLTMKIQAVLWEGCTRAADDDRQYRHLLPFG